MSAVEIPSLRRINSKHYDLGDGRVMVEIGSQRHFSWNEKWRDLDLTLFDEGNNNYRVRGHEFALEADGGGLSVFHRKSGRGIRFLFPRPPDRVDGRSAYWTLAAGVEWKFTLGRLGLKAEATISARRGPRTYSFDGQMLGGLAPPNPDVDGNLVQPAGRFVIPRSVVIGANQIRYVCGPWTRVGGTVSFDFDDTALPDEAFPYVIDPTTTFNVAASADDGSTFASNAVYASIPTSGGGGIDTTGTGQTFAEKKFQTGTYWVSSGIITWDTSAIPDNAIIDSVELQIWMQSVGDTDARNLLIDWYSGRPLDGADFLKTGTGTAADMDLSLIVAGALNTIPLIGFATGVNKTGYTGIQGTISGGAPTADNSCWFSTFDHASDPEPKLLVTYGAVAAPAPGTPGQHFPQLSSKAWF